jgi:hypothetical protein
MLEETNSEVFEQEQTEFTEVFKKSLFPSVASCKKVTKEKGLVE